MQHKKPMHHTNVLLAGRRFLRYMHAILCNKLDDLMSSNQSTITPADSTSAALPFQAQYISKFSYLRYAAIISATVVLVCNLTVPHTSTSQKQKHISRADKH